MPGVPHYQVAPEANLVGWLFTRPVLKVLNATSGKPRSGQEVWRVTGVPIAACYRIIKELAARDLLLAAETLRTPRGRMVTRYTSNVARLAVALEHGRLTLRIERRDGLVLSQEFEGQSVRLALSQSPLLRAEDR